MSLDRIPTRLRRAAIACVAAAIVYTPAAADPLGRAAIAQQTRKAWHDWRSDMRDSGWTGLQPRIAACFKSVAARPSQQQVVYCAVLDHLTLLDTLSFPERLRPPYFTTSAVFARLDKAVAESTPRGDRKLFESRLLSTMDETLHQMK